MEQLTLRDLIGYWEFHNRTEGKSPATVRWYNDILEMFERFLEAREESVQIGDIGEPQVRAYVAYLQQKHKWDDTDRCPTARMAVARLGLFSMAVGRQNSIRALR